MVESVVIDPSVGVGKPAGTYREATDALAGALDRLAEKRTVVEQCTAALSKASAEYESAREVAAKVRAALEAHLINVLPAPNAANRRP